MVRKINPKKAKRKGSKNGPSSSSSMPSMPTKVWQPGVDKLEEDEELQCDPTAYNSLHAFHVGWPCLRGATLMQAEKAAWNSVGIFKVSNVSGKRRELVPSKKSADLESAAGDDDDEDSSDSEDDSEDEEAGASKAPTLQMRRLAHGGCVNRICAMTQSPHICATWSDSGHVQLANKVGVCNLNPKFVISDPFLQIWDVSSHLNALAESETEPAAKDPPVVYQAPVVNFKGHKDEGYAMDWSPHLAGRMVTGDCRNFIHLWEPTSAASWNVDPTPFVGHTASVEDLQWSPTEDNIFVSCSVDGTIALWDTRRGKSPALRFKAHNADVNVLSWNRLASVMLASGCDDGTFSIRDLRLLKENMDGDTSVVAHFDYHKHPITSIEWSQHEASTLAVSSADNQLTIWDLTLERDEEEETEFKAQTKEQVNAPADIPPQLLFVHQGQKDLKEVHWHAQIPGMIMSTASDGFNVLMPSNIQSTLP
ncbi:Protein HEAT STRESS TOLERANT DWD 1 [Linum grandiflorum]